MTGTVFHLTFALIIAGQLSLQLHAEQRQLGVCEALKSGEDHQTVEIRATIAATNHSVLLYEGDAHEPCPGWRSRFLTAPSAILLLFGSYPGIQVSGDTTREIDDFLNRIRALQRAEPSARRIVTVRGVLIRKRLPLMIRGVDGVYCCWGEGVNGDFGAALVVTAPPFLVP
jgi:hypothetical protein